MGHTNNPNLIDPKILVTESDLCVSVEFEGAAVPGKFAANTKEEAVEKMIAWYENQAARSEQIAFEEAEMAKKLHKTVEDIKALVSNEK